MSRSSAKPTILVVDDTPNNIDVLSGILRPQYRVIAALNGPAALKITEKLRPDMILLDIMMPEMDGYHVCSALKENPATSGIPVIFVTAKTATEDERRGFEVGAVDFLTKPVSPPIVLARVQTQLALYDQNRVLDEKVNEQTAELVDTRLEIIRCLGRAAEFKDNETGLHVIRMSYYSRLIAESLDYSEQWTELVFNASPMHDIGKIGIPDHILLKRGRLNEEEWRKMKKHAEYGAAVIGEHDSDILQMAKEIALSHHEKWDGSGYPSGLKGEQIPITGRIVALADVFDALTSSRPYKKAWTVEDAVSLIDANSGTHFDPELVPIFHARLPEMLDIKDRYAEDLDTVSSIT